MKIFLLIDVAAQKVIASDNTFHRDLENPKDNDPRCQARRAQARNRESANERYQRFDLEELFERWPWYEACMFCFGKKEDGSRFTAEEVMRRDDLK